MTRDPLTIPEIDANLTEIQRIYHAWLTAPEPPIHAINPVECWLLTDELLDARAEAQRQMMYRRLGVA